MKQKKEGILIVTGLYPNETDRKRSGTRAPLLNVLCVICSMLTKFAPVNVAISKAAFYDELPEDSWRDLYCEYIGIGRAVLEQIMQMALGDLHFIMRDIKKPTTEELKEIIAEVEQMVNDSEELET